MARQTSGGAAAGGGGDGTDKKVPDYWSGERGGYSVKVEVGAAEGGKTRLDPRPPPTSFPMRLPFPGLTGAEQWVGRGSPKLQADAGARGSSGVQAGVGRPRKRALPGEGNGHPLQYFGLENSKNCIVRGVAKSRTR